MIPRQLVPMLACVVVINGACGTASSQTSTTRVLPPTTAPEPDAAPTVEPKATEDAPPAPDDVTALLDAIEVSGRDLRGFTSDVRYETIDALLGDKVIRTGRLIYDAGADVEARRLAILFDATIENRRKREQLKHFVFADGWLVEIDHERKQFVKRQIVAPGETFDPFKLGEGPIPLPIGQSRAEVLKQFVVTRIELPESGPLAKLRDADPVDGLRLVPRQGRVPREEFRQIDLFYDQATRLPVGVDAIEVNGDRKIARLRNLVRGADLSPEDQARLDVAVPDEREWRIDIRPFGG